ncbi:MAG TPA: hypothetical protein DIW52_12430 [Pseudomonas sp.]|nr:hypothetical protein [Pseudomonas sp.]
MEHWKRTIERANRCFMLGELVDAREAYLQALALAQVLLERWADTRPVAVCPMPTAWPWALLCRVCRKGW